MQRQRGFTLIELLVVIVIIGIVMTIAGLSIGVLGRDTQAEDQARRLYAVLTQVREEAELQGKDIGLLIERDGYQFMRYNYAMRQWQDITNDELMARRVLPEGLTWKLWLEGREVVLKSHTENQALLAQSSSSASSSDSVGPLSNNMVSASNSNNVTPQIAILSSGELSPFELRIQREGTDYAWRLTGAANSTLDIDSGDDSTLATARSAASSSSSRPAS